MASISFGSIHEETICEVRGRYRTIFVSDMGTVSAYMQNSFGMVDWYREFPDTIPHADRMTRSVYSEAIEWAKTAADAVKAPDASPPTPAGVPASSAPHCSQPSSDVPAQGSAQPPRS